MIAALGASPVSLERDMERIKAMRARSVARTNRFLDARLRTIGLDTDAIDAQICERRLQSDRERVEAMAEYERNECVYKKVAMQEAEERHLRDKELQKTRVIWQEQMKYKKEKEKKEKEDIHRGVDFDTCGASALQKMAGEDPEKFVRVELQRKQMRNWTTQQMACRREREAKEKEDAATYWAHLKRVNEVQGKLSAEEKAARKDLNVHIKDENCRRACEKAEEHAHRKQQENEANDQELRYRDKFLRDAESGGNTSASDLVFKGIFKQQKGNLNKANKEILEAKSREAEQDREQEITWFLDQERVRAAMDQADEKERCRVKDAEVSILHELHEQRRQSRERNRRDRQERFGEINYTHGLYAGFGKSCR